MINQDFLDKYVSKNLEKEAKDFNKAVKIYMDAGFDRAHAEDMVRRGCESIRKMILSGELTRLPEVKDVEQDDEEIL